MESSGVSLGGSGGFESLSWELKSRLVKCLMDYWPYDETEMLKPNYLIKCVGRLSKQAHGGGLIHLKVRCRVTWRGYGVGHEREIRSS